MSSSKRPLEHREKVVLIIISVIGASVLFLGYLQLSYQIRAAFTPQNLQSAQPRVQNYGGDLANALDSQLQVGEELKTKDTDRDGMSDYDELKVYKTSPYLDDSDSDGKSDKAEVEAGTDPNCPEGKKCQQVSENSSNSTPPLLSTEPATAPSSASLETELRQAVPIEKLRQLLVEQGGLTKEQVDQIDDATLRRVYEETLANLNQQVNQ